jgi:hypothetical protein
VGIQFFNYGSPIKEFGDDMRNGFPIKPVPECFYWGTFENDNKEGYPIKLAPSLI